MKKSAVRRFCVRSVMQVPQAPTTEPKGDHFFLDTTRTISRHCLA